MNQTILRAGDPDPGAALPTPGLVGRLVRVGLGSGVLLLLASLLGPWRDELWSGHLPLELGFGVLVALALTFTGYVFNLAFGLAWGRRTLAGVLAGAALAGLGGFAAEGAFPNPWLGIYVWSWLVAFCALLGPAHLLAAALGTPGCEMRSYAHLRALLRGGDVAGVACPGGIDRLDPIRIQGRSRG